MLKRMTVKYLGCLCACLLALAAVTVHAQQVNSPDDLAATFAEEQAGHEDCLKANAQVAARINELSRIVNQDDKLREILLLNQDIKELLNDLNLAAQHQASLLAWLDKAPDNRALLPQEEQARAHYRKEIDKMGREQTKLKTLLGKRQNQLRLLMGKIPPPASFTTDSGITMLLIKTGDKSFYFSSQPVTRQEYQKVLQALRPNEDGEATLLDQPEAPIGELNHTQAVQFCQMLSRQEGAKANYHLPTVAELSAAANLPAPPIAVWTATPWGDKRDDELANQKRFGIQMQTIWDPSHILTTDETQVFFRELAFAAYGKLGIMVAADVKTGNLQRLNRLQKELQTGGK